jgi:hypothetical protein
VLSSQHHQFDMVSFSEGAIEKHISKAPKALVRMHTKQFSRIYPGGYRMDSSNVCFSPPSV